MERGGNEKGHLLTLVLFGRLNFTRITLKLEYGNRVLPIVNLQYQKSFSKKYSCIIAITRL